MSSERIQQWDERYLAGEQVFDRPSPLVVQFTRDLAPGSALDLASGPGRNALYLAEHGWQVTALDGSSVGIELLQNRARERKLSVDARVADLESGKIGARKEGFDLVLSCYFFERLLIPASRAAVKAGGLLIAISHLADADQPQGTPTRTYPGELRSLFQDWRILHYREGEPGESCHRHAVAELVAQKPG